MSVEKIVSTPFSKIWTESLGVRSEKPLLLVSGAGAHARFWTDTFCAPFLQEGYFVIRYDHRDVGLSEATPADYEIKLLVEDVLEILNAYDIGRVHLVGHSMGGYIAQLMSVYYPERLRSITIISAGPVGETSALKVPSTQDERDVLATTWKVMLDNHPTENYEESEDGYMAVWERLNGLYPLDRRMASAYTKEFFFRSKYRPGIHEKHIKAMQKMAATLNERREFFSKIKTPTLIIHGEEDYLIPSFRGGHALAEVLPDARFELVPKMGHMLFNFELEHLISQKIISFLNEI